MAIKRRRTRGGLLRKKNDNKNIYGHVFAVSRTSSIEIYKLRATTSIFLSGCWDCWRNNLNKISLNIN